MEKHNCNCNHGEHEHKHDHGHEGCCGGSCGHDSHEEAEKIYLTLDDGEELECDVIGVFEVENKEYIALLPVGEEDAFLYTFEETEEGPVLDQISSDEEFEMVAKAFTELYQ
ncbi:MAG: DUF1292 domain-containing protein [Anaeromicrobium sp.]|jgi:uncharacterized protein YrzB (UPF0473 family)|uniref:DUF1292 domain-containing protein n=1 Tax=Anaeromicrobium sp. TaxID=1929132 RepID=UPI0025DCF06C|nr:DUF1292 domain-containing protein [Anaeromicrobium sp.]MCT4595958.1 DUF1292 domain-containing protein [Anaeromicrobium sp.]